MGAADEPSIDDRRGRRVTHEDACARHDGGQAKALVEQVAPADEPVRRQFTVVGPADRAGAALVAHLDAEHPMAGEVVGIYTDFG